MSKIIILVALIFLTISNGASMNTPAFKYSLESFSNDLFNTLSQSRPGENIIYSPFSIQTCLATVRMGAGGQTAAVLDRGLGFTGQTLQSLADNYFELLRKYEHSGIVETANKVYVMQGYQLQNKYQDVLYNKFFSSAENIDFGQSENAAWAMNSWVETKTHKMVKNLIKPEMLNTDTRLFLLSVIYFKGEWKKAFNVHDTIAMDFRTDVYHKVKVQFMSKEDQVPYGYFPELDSQVIRMPYKNSDLSMWIFLPTSVNGLKALETKLTNVHLASLAHKMGWPQSVKILMPKFKAEFELDLKEILKKMGMGDIFGNADFSNMLQYNTPLQISNIIHKACIEVDEAGTTAAAATGAGMLSRTISIMPNFVADHPFYYVIANEDFVPLFQGTVKY